MQVITYAQDALLITLHVVWVVNKGGLWCDREWKLSCRLQVGMLTLRGSVGGVTDSLCIYAGSDDTAFRWLSLLCRIMRGSFQETAPRKTAENTVKHSDDIVALMVASHRDGGESSVVVTTLM